MKHKKREDTIVITKGRKVWLHKEARDGNKIGLARASVKRMDEFGILVVLQHINEGLLTGIDSSAQLKW